MLCCKSNKIGLFQSTHPHGVRLIRVSLFIFPLCFNPRTHTGCDTPNNVAAPSFAVSIHAPTRGATKLHYYFSATSASFNPRTHTGCDDAGEVRGSRNLGFNPRTHTGCDLISSALSVNHFAFQSTHPHGVRHIRCRFATFRLLFQSTHPHGVRLSEV